MIIGKGKPQPRENTDRWGWLDGTYSVSEPVRVGRALWEKLWKFENFENYTSNTYGPMTPTSYAALVEAAIRSCPQVSTIWQFDGDTLDCKDKIRMTAMFNTPTLVEWTWFDVHVRYPLARARAWWLNRRPRRHVLGSCWDAKLTPQQGEAEHREINEDCGP